MYNKIGHDLFFLHTCNGIDRNYTATGRQGWSAVVGAPEAVEMCRPLSVKSNLGYNNHFSLLLFIVRIKNTN
jgi:hypothetical protein